MSQTTTVVLNNTFGESFFGPGDAIRFTYEDFEYIYLADAIEPVSIIVHNAPGANGEPGPQGIPGPSGEVDPDDFAEIAGDAAELALELLDPPIDLVVLFDNALV